MDICMLGFLFLRLTARSSRSSCTPGQCARQLSCLCHDSVSNSLFCPGRIARIYRTWGIIMTLIIRKKRHISCRESQEFPQSLPIPHPWQMAQPYAAMTGLHALHQTQPCIFDLLLLPFFILAFTRAGFAQWKIRWASLEYGSVLTACILQIYINLIKFTHTIAHLMKASS